jgi:hypothetical protein
MGASFRTGQIHPAENEDGAFTPGIPVYSGEQKSDSSGEPVRRRHTKCDFLLDIYA